MIVTKTKKDLLEILSKFKAQKITVAFVPTMGALHHGHLSLVKQAKEIADKVVVSIFVNPTQFNDIEDYNKYPRNDNADLALLQNENCDLVFTPNKAELYDKGEATSQFDFGNLDKVMEGSNRPGHFDGVRTIVSKLFDLVQPNFALFGEKDYQQLAIVKQLCNQKFPNIKITGVKTYREENGLASSSRNQRLSQKSFHTAAKLYQLLKYCAYNKSITPNELKLYVTQQLKLIDAFTLEYFEIRDENTFDNIENWTDSETPRAFIAATIEGVRLIDNLSLNT